MSALGKSGHTTSIARPVLESYVILDRLCALEMGGRARPQHLPKLPIALEMPFAAHGCASSMVSFGVEKNATSSPRRFCASTRVMLLKTPAKIGRPPNVGLVFSPALVSKNVDVTVHDLS